MYHFYCPSLPKMIKLTDIRKRKIECRFKEMNSDYSVFEKIFRKMENSKFMRGDNDRGWKATLEWVISNSENWIKILEGKYDNNATEKNHKPENVNDLWK